MGSTMVDTIVDLMVTILELDPQFAEDLNVSVDQVRMDTIVDHMDLDQVVTMVDYMEQDPMDTSRVQDTP